MEQILIDQGTNFQAELRVRAVRRTPDKNVTIPTKNRRLLRTLQPEKDDHSLRGRNRRRLGRKARNTRVCLQYCDSVYDQMNTI